MSANDAPDGSTPAHLQVLARAIAEEHDRLGHQLGWLGLYSPARTLSPSTRVAFVGLNPGGSRWEPPRASCEQGNAYRVEGWAPDGSHNRLQQQIGLLYDALAGRLDVDAASLMDDTLAMNFCPFRSSSWSALASPRESVAFSRGMWDGLLTACRPTVMLCLGDLAAREMGQALQRAGACAEGTESVPVGWGNVTLSLSQLSFESGQTLLVRLPHLSRFSIFGRTTSQPAVDELMGAAAAALEGSRPRGLK